MKNALLLILAVTTIVFMLFSRKRMSMYDDVVDTYNIQLSEREDKEIYLLSELNFYKEQRDSCFEAIRNLKQEDKYVSSVILYGEEMTYYLTNKNDMELIATEMAKVVGLTVD